MYQFNAAIKHFDDGQFAESVESLRESIAVSPDSPHPYFHLGLALIQLDRYEEAILNLSLAREHGMRDGQPEYFTAYALSELGQKEEAKRILTALSENVFNDHVALRAKAFLLYEEGSYARCIRLCEIIDEETSEDEPPFPYYPLALVMNKEYARAKPLILDALKSTSDRHIYYYLLGICEEMTGRKRDAIVAYERCMELDADNLSCIMRLGGMYLRSGRIRDFLGVVKRVVEIEDKEREQKAGKD